MSDKKEECLGCIGFTDEHKRLNERIAKLEAENNMMRDEINTYCDRQIELLDGKIKETKLKLLGWDFGK